MRRLPWRASPAGIERGRAGILLCVFGLHEVILGPRLRVTPHLWRDLSSRVESSAPRICVTSQISAKSYYGEHYELEPLVDRDLLLLAFCEYAQSGRSGKGWKLENEPDSSANPAQPAEGSPRPLQ